MPFILLAIIAAIIGAATIVENSMGTPFVLDNIYGAWWMKCLWAVMSTSAVWVIIKRKLWHRLSVFLLHISFLVILAGAMLTSFLREKGLIHLRTGDSVSAFMTKEKRIVYMPFQVRLDTFSIDYYPGTETPSNYISNVTCLTPDGTVITTGRISMNNILRHNGYRLYQTSFDEDLQGSWLTVNHDPWGIAVTYTGYILLAISTILILFLRGGKLRKLLKHPLLRKSALMAMLTIVTPTALATGTEECPLPAIRLEEADKHRSAQIIYNDRIAPFNTLAIDFVTKLYGKSSFRGLSPEQVIISWQLHPNDWSKAKIIRIKSGQLRSILNMETDHASINDLFNSEGQYILSDLYKKEAGTHSKLEKAIIETDEKVAIIQMLTNGTLIKPVPHDTEPLSSMRIDAELLYNSIPFSKILFMANLTMGFILMFFTLYIKKAVAIVRIISSITLYLSTAFLLSAFLLRWYISQTIPLTNGYETMVFVALATLLIALFLHRHISVIAPFGLIISGFTLLVSHLAQMNPQITPLMPVLQSPLLSSHVALIMLSYSLFAFMALNGAASLALMRKPSGQEQAQRLTIISRIMLYPATLLLGIGIFIGAVWANVSWGSYWNWDPKEVWALVTMIVYAIAFHDTSIPWLRSDRAFNTYILLASLTVLMTYFGVNYLLGGMHSYANT